MSFLKCPCQEFCIHFTTGDSKPKNNDVRDKYICKKYLKGCEHSLYVETMIMGLVVACKIKEKK